jgi:hypothetical protein
VSLGIILPLPFLFLSELAALPKDLIAPNNHYPGFGLGTADIFRNMLGSPVFPKTPIEKTLDIDKQLILINPFVNSSLIMRSLFMIAWLRITVDESYLNTFHLKLLKSHYMEFQLIRNGTCSHKISYS